MTATLTLEAQHRLDRYLSQVRALLRAAPKLDADEIERDIRSHIDTELADRDHEVTAEELENVLRRLGSPTQWVDEDEVPWWRRTLATLHSGEDWRLSYLCLGTTSLGLLLLLAGTPVALALFAAGFVLARAALSLAEERDEALGPRRWLVLPAIAVVVVPVLAALVLGPLIGLGQAGYDEGWFAATAIGEARVDPPAREALVRASLVAAGVGAWWLLLAAGWGLLQRAVASFARPLYEPTPVHRRRFAVAGAVLTALGVAALLLAGAADVAI